MQLKFNELAAVVYAELFDWPLTPPEAKIWAIETGQKDRRSYFWQPRAKLLRERERREKIAQEKVAVAKKITGALMKIPTIEGIFLTGSVAVGNATKGSDIDLMIVTAPGALWLTRVIVILLLKAKKLYRSHSASASRDKVCPNIFLDTEHLEVKEKNLYTAHEVLQVRCLSDQGGVAKKWFLKNIWTGKYLSLAAQAKNARLLPGFVHRGPGLRFFARLACVPFELAAFVAQYFYMRSKMTNERVGWGYAFFHPNQLGEKIEEKFWQRLVKYTDK